MGCSSSKQKQGSPMARVLEYQKESQTYQRDVKLQPKHFQPENFRCGYISAAQFFNQLHDGFCGPYIANPNYMLLVDFRTYEEYSSSHILTAVHHSSLRWDMSSIGDLEKYSRIVFYDHDGTAAANIYSCLTTAFRTLTVAQIEVQCILGGIARIQDRFPHMMATPGKGQKNKTKLRKCSVSSTTSTTPSVSASPTSNNYNHTPIMENHNNNNSVANGKVHMPEAFLIPWLPSLVLGDSLFLGRLEQAGDRRVIKTLGITHVVSVGRSPNVKCKGVKYLGLDGDRNLYVAFLAASEFIQSALEKGGKILVHGIDGLNRSAAVMMAYTMSTATCVLEDAHFYLKTLRPHLSLDEESLSCLLRWERSIFGTELTEIDDLWF